MAINPPGRGSLCVWRDFVRFRHGNEANHGGDRRADERIPESGIKIEVDIECGDAERKESADPAGPEVNGRDINV
jgi:hypothetical protein